MFLTLVGPIGPFVEFGGYRDSYEKYEKTIRELELPVVLEAIRGASTRYPRWLDDVEAATCSYAPAHPEHEQAIDDALWRSRTAHPRPSLPDAVPDNVRDAISAWVVRVRLINGADSFKQP